MNRLSPGPRDYRLTEMLGNGAVVLDAEDAIMAYHRRFLEALDVPTGATLGSTLRRWEDGHIELLSEVVAQVGGAAVLVESPQDEMIQLSPALGAIIQATVTTVAREFDLSINVAAHIIRTWLKVEYLL